MKIEIVGKTDKGKVRNVNQDNFRIERLGKQTYACVVCDGMGGIRGGSEASCIAAVSFMICLKRLCAQEPHETTKNLLTRSLNEANTAGYSFASSTLNKSAFVNFVGNIPTTTFVGTTSKLVLYLVTVSL